MARMRRPPRWANWTLLVLFSGVWVLDAYKLVTGLTHMGQLSALPAGMCFLIGPALLLKEFSERRRPD